MNLPTHEENPKGLHAKYVISKTNGMPVDPEAEYFVLRLDDQGDKEHVEACRTAILEYARKIEHFIPDLASDLINRYGP